MKDRLCLECFQRRASVCVTCDACGSDQFMGLTTRQIEILDELTAPRRVTVTEAQAEKIVNAHRVIRRQQADIDALMEQVNIHAVSIQQCNNVLDAVMAEINGEAVR